MATKRRVKLKRKMESNFFHCHLHSHFSTLDAMAPVEEMVAKAAKLGQPAIALTDHGNMSGAFKLYREAKKYGMLPFPGVEAYIVSDVEDKSSARFHLTMMARTTKGYQGLVKLVSRSHTRPWYQYKPRMSYADLQEFGEEYGKDFVVLTGCRFGLVQSALVDQQDIDLAVSRAEMIASWFSNTYVELQHHNITHDTDLIQHDDDLVRVLYKDVAGAAGLPVIATQDCHYCDLKHRPLHNFMKTLAYGQDDPGDDFFPGDGFHLASSGFVSEHYPDDIWQECEDSYAELINSYKLSIPPLDKYQYHVPTPAGVKESSLSYVQKVCKRALAKKGLNVLTYRKRLAYEFDTLEATGFADYFVLIENLCKWMREQDILFNARGSANGFLVCYLMGITNIDPVRWRLDPDRFLTADRDRPPDIDLDVEDERRADVIEHLKTIYDLVQIGTYGKLGVTEDEYGEAQGGLFVTYISSLRRRLGPDRFKQEFPGKVEWRDLPKQDRDKLNQLADFTLYKSPGAHAAGFVLSAPHLKIEDWLPTMLIPSSNTTVTQMTMDDVEDAGFVKIDLLGLRTLSTLRVCMELLGRSPWEWIDIPLDDKETMQFLRQGVEGNGVFQFEGYAASKGCREVKPRKLNDLILINALYRPAARDSGYTTMYLSRKRGHEKPRYLHPIYEKHLKETLGVPAYQEQVLAVLRDLGMGPVEMNQFLKAVKGKHSVGGYNPANTRLFEQNRKKFNDLCKAKGIKNTDEAWKLVEGFHGYGFNKAHATSYSFLGYVMAYLKVHHPLEFHCALLRTTAGSKKEKLYVRETRRAGVRVLGADVNVSGANWTIDHRRKALRRGLASIPGVGPAAAACIEEHAPFSSIEDMIERCPARPVSGGKSFSKDGVLTGVYAKLKAAGALASLGIEGDI